MEMNGDSSDPIFEFFFFSFLFFFGILAFVFGGPVAPAVRARAAPPLAEIKRRKMERQQQQQQKKGPAENHFFKKNSKRKGRGKDSSSSQWEAGKREHPRWSLVNVRFVGFFL